MRNILTMWDNRKDNNTAVELYKINYKWQDRKWYSKPKEKITFFKARKGENGRRKIWKEF